jgi:hypothetical protein
MPSHIKQGNCVFLIDSIGHGTEGTVLAVGRVVPVNTADREPTQNPMTGFDCQGTPLGRGHIIALFLGGPDIPANYAPQYEQWQQGGEWKNMELSIRQDAVAAAGAGLYMVVKLTYGRNGNIYFNERDAFQSGDNLAPWTDYRIPTAFDVYTFRGDAPGAAAVVADVFGANVVNSTNAMTSLTTRAFVTLKQSFDHSSIPDEDYQFWLRNLVRRWAGEAALDAKKKCEEEMPIAVLAAKTKAEKPPTSSKSGIQKSTFKPARFSRVDQANVEESVRVKYGFGGNRNLSEQTWKSDSVNIPKIADYVKAQLNSRADHMHVKLGDYNNLVGGGAGAIIEAYLTT